MVALSITHNFPQVQRALQQLPAQVAERALANTVNRVLEQARTQMVRAITAEYRISASTVRDRLRLRRAAFRAGVLNVSADLSAGGRRAMNVIHFSATRAQAGVTVRIRKGGGAKVIRGAFIGNKGRTVFERIEGTTMRSRSRYSGTQHAQRIKPVQTIDVPQMFNARRINERVLAFIREALPRRFEQEARFALSKFASR